MKNYYKTPSKIFVLLFAITLYVSNLHAGDNNKINKDAIKYIEKFLSDDAARKDFSKNNPNAAEAENLLKTFPPETQKRIENIMLMLLKTHGSDAEKFEKALEKEGGEEVFSMFSPEIKDEIKKISTELSKNPKVLEKLMNNPTVKKAISENK